MKEFIEKLIGRLEETDLNDIQMVVREVLLKYGFPYESVVQDEVWDALDELSTNKFAIGIINELAEEYNSDFCEWQLRQEKQNYDYTTCDGTTILMGEPTDYEFCPFCGKKIKVTPYQPKGE